MRGLLLGGPGLVMSRFASTLTVILALVTSLREIR